MIILKASNISKQYRLGLVGTGTISHDLNRWWAGVRGKEDPFLKIGSVNDRSTKADSDYVWALRDINFEVKKGEVLGIIGKNGAGKSTLLKILSRVTGPTTGEIKTKGRIASLLEVGTGFHPELTGRENIYLNGAILGMTKAEIKAKEDEIIEFSGCERYVDTPVKRYSSGMRVRLAFAVAAHLEPDILVIDEVLAVGDAEFQKKAIGKMQDISKGDGRTVLFVSHNMAAVKSLCTRGILLENGLIKHIGDIDTILNMYQNENDEKITTEYFGNKIIKKAVLKSNNGNIKYKSHFELDVFFKSNIPINNLVVGIVIKDENYTSIIGINNKHYGYERISSENVTEGKVSIRIKELKLLPGSYKVDLFIGDSFKDLESVEDAIKLTIIENHSCQIVNNLNFKINKMFHEDVKWNYYLK